MSNLARDFQNIVARKQLEAITERNFESLKDITLSLYDQNLALKEMLEQLMKESLIGNTPTN
jgi:hypothetical protein